MYRIIYYGGILSGVREHVKKLGEDNKYHLAYKLSTIWYINRDKMTE